jgi:acyl-CoA synthetase (AMP-forming)/AMP-acid ligase II/thioesterase domain-containing protein
MHGDQENAWVDSAAVHLDVDVMHVKSIKHAKPHLSSSSETVDTLSQLLTRAAASLAGITFYPLSGNCKTEGIEISYCQLLARATEKARLLQEMNDVSPSTIFLLHFSSHLENIEWFWAATLAGFVPAISTPFVNDLAQRRKHLAHLQTLLNKPVILTSRTLVSEFLESHELNIRPVESLRAQPGTISSRPMPEKRGDEIAALMLTSGSTGNAKAVPLSHSQILTSVHGKSAHHGTTSSSAFLNWIGLDHVANLTEIHLHAMSLCANQIQVQAADLLQDPLHFLRLLGKHKVEYTFAPNFFLTKLRDYIDANPGFRVDLRDLKALISGGESNVVSTCAALTAQLRRFGVEDEVIRPGFGMTETCAGSIYSRACPSFDMAQGLEYANLGSCVPGIQMRIVNSAGVKAKAGDMGDLQVSGPIVFKGYFNNPSASKEGFTEDGWFITGDVAYIDAAGNLNLTGRSKDTIIVNGVKYSSSELETAIEEEMIPGLVPSFTVAFPHRPEGAATEQICVVYHPNFPAGPGDAKTRFETATAISKVVAMITTKAPDQLIPLPKQLLEKSSLGKISRTKVRAAFEKGEYTTFKAHNTEVLAAYRASQWRSATTSTEILVQDILSSLVSIHASSINVRSSIFDLGVTSFTLITLKRHLELALPQKIDIPLSILLNTPTIEEISASIDTLLSKPQTYDPIVPLQPNGSKTPLFCIHPGSGEIFVFIALAAQFTTRPVYALRTRGYNPDESFFESIAETAETYTKHIRNVQPEGPYAITGYSLGSILAFEVSKMLEAQGQEVKFCGSIDYSPYVKHHVENLNWVDVMLHISFFLGLITEEKMLALTPSLRALPHQEAIAHILEVGCKERVKALAMDAEKLTLMTDIGENFRKGVATYDPLGSVQSVDVFVADPPKYAARDRRDWRENKLGRWREFSRGEVVFHDCMGVHAKMMDREYIVDFARKMKAALRQRGI